MIVGRRWRPKQMEDRRWRSLQDLLRKMQVTEKLNLSFPFLFIYNLFPIYSGFGSTGSNSVIKITELILVFIRSSTLRICVWSVLVFIFKEHHPFFVATVFLFLFSDLFWNQDFFNEIQISINQRMNVSLIRI